MNAAMTLRLEDERAPAPFEGIAMTIESTDDHPTRVMRARVTASIVSAFGIALALVAIAAVAAPSVYPTRVTRYDPALAYNCDVLFSAPDSTPADKTYLIDMNGHVLHVWNHLGFPSKMIDPALLSGTQGEIGVQLSAISASPGAGQTGLMPGRASQFRNETIGLVDWAGKTVWQWGTHAPGGAALQHHDWELLPNGDMLILANQRVRVKAFGNRRVLDDVIYEVNRGGKIVWTWKASDHIGELGFTPSQMALIAHSSAPDYLHMNDMEALGPNHWAQAGDRRFSPDNIMISSRNTSFIAIISRRTGNIVWRLGPNFPPARNPAGPLGPGSRLPRGAIGQLSGDHDAHLIPPGLPGAGNILVFDNEGTAGYPPDATPLTGGSRVLEINPVTRKIVWEYTGTKITMYSPYISSVQRLPNGNTLVDEGMDGRFFQVTPGKKIVWEYVSPFFGRARGPGRRSLTNSVYRIQGVPYSWVPLPGPHSQVPVHAPDLSEFHIPAGQR